MRIYLDNAATTPISEEVIEVMTDCLRNHFGNPSSIHSEGRQVRALIEKARKQIAGYIGASIGEVFFTSGGTESNNTALKCAVRDLGVQHVITTRLEHHCILHSVESLERDHDIKITYLANDKYGCIDQNELISILQQSGEKTLVSVMHANNEIGTLQDIESIGKICSEYNALFHSDTVQTIGHYPIDVSTLNIDFLSGAAHKFHGPKGVGFLYINSRNMIKPFIDGGAQERNMRGGTENVYGIAGMARALEIATEHMEARKNHISGIRSYMINRLKEEIEGICINGHPVESLYTVLNVAFPPTDKSEMLLMLLDIHGISCSGGSACSSGSEKASHVIQAIGQNPNFKSVRFSFSHYNTLQEIDRVVETLLTLIPQKATSIKT